MRLRSRSLSPPTEKSSASGDPVNSRSAIFANMTANLNFAHVPFTRKDAASWFRQLEAIFTINKVTDDSLRYVYVQARVDPTILSEISDFFVNPPEADKYTQLKNRMIKQYSDSPEKNARKLLEGLTLGDRRPSELLREMRTLADGKIDDEFLRSMFLQRLPQQAQFVLASCSERLEKIADMADRMMDTTGQLRVAEVNSVSRSDTTNAHLALLMEQMTKLVQQVGDLTLRLDRLTVSPNFNTDNRSRTPYRSDQQNRDRSASRDRYGAPVGVNLCYYHYVYGNKARKCKQTLENGTACSMYSAPLSGN